MLTRGGGDTISCRPRGGMRVFPKCNARLNIIQNIVILSAESRERKVYK
jgi:hypothetical protein